MSRSIGDQIVKPIGAPAMRRGDYIACFLLRGLQVFLGFVKLP